MLKYDWLLTALIYNSNRTEWSQIRSVIIRVINKKDLLLKSMITNRIGRHKVLLAQLIINITLSEDLRKDKKMLKGVN